MIGEIIVLLGACMHFLPQQAKSDDNIVAFKADRVSTRFAPAKLDRRQAR
jgi:hypothetical protein